MNNLKSLVQEYLRDTMYEAEVMLRSSRDYNITIISDNLRGVCGITVCTITSPAEPISSKVERTYLKVKFFQLESTMEDHVARMSNEARRIDGVFSFIVKKVGKVQSRIYRSK